MQTYYTYKCAQCGKEFSSWRLKKKFCSKTCFGIHRSLTHRSKPENFWARVDKTSNPNGCWDWLGPVNRTGYGKLTWNTKDTVAHRVAWELANGRPVPDGMCVCHSCDRRICCRPDHLWTGSNVDNIADRTSKGRSWHSDGELDGMAKLTWDKVNYIREQVAAGCVQRQLAKELSMSPAAICLVVNRKTWR